MLVSQDYISIYAYHYAAQDKCNIFDGTYMDPKYVPMGIIIYIYTDTHRIYGTGRFIYLI